MNIVTVFMLIISEVCIYYVDLLFSQKILKVIRFKKCLVMFL